MLAALARDPGGVGSVLLMSDGAERTVVRDPDADPLASARALAERGVRVYAVPFGSDGAPTAGIDLAVERLTVDPVAFVKKQVPVSGAVRVVGGANREFEVRLLLETRLPGGETEMRPVEPTGDARPVVRVTPTGGNQQVPVELTFIPDVPGEVKLALEIVPVDGEVKTTNNRRATVISVKAGGIRVLYFDRIRPEVNALRRVNLSDKIQLDFVELPSRPNNLSPGLRLEASLFEPGRYDAFIIGDVAADAFREGNRDFLRDLAARVDDGAGLMIDRRAEQLRPRRLRRLAAAAAPAGRDGPRRPGRRRRRAGPDRRRNPDAPHTPRAAELRDAADGPRRERRTLAVPPPAERGEPTDGEAGARGRNPRRGAGRPAAPDRLRVRTRRVLAFAGDTTWLWPLAGNADEHARFWRQVVLWLTRKEEDNDGPVFVSVEPRNVAPGRPARLKFGARDVEGEPVSDASFTVEVTGPTGEIAALTPRAAGADRPGLFVAEAADTAAPGDYRVRVRATKDGALLGPDATTRFIVDAVDLELDNPAADPGALAEITALTGGAVVPPEELTAFLEKWAADPPGGAEQTVLSRTPLYDGWWLPLLFAALLGTEWYLRKKRGLV